MFRIIKFACYFYRFFFKPKLCHLGQSNQKSEKWDASGGPDLWPYLHLPTCNTRGFSKSLTYGGSACAVEYHNYHYRIWSKLFLSFLVIKRRESLFFVLKLFFDFWGGGEALLPFSSGFKFLWNDLTPSHSKTYYWIWTEKVSFLFIYSERPPW